MNAEPSEEYERCMFIAKESMAPFFKEYDLEWNDQERLDLCKACNLFIVSDFDEIGFFMLREGETQIFLADLQVMEKHRNKGYGARILEMAKNMARDKGFREIWLKVFKSNPALSLYRRNGYVLQREEEFVYVLSCST